MKASALRKLYPKLGGAERFRLLALSLSRGDVAEAEHVITSSPRVAVWSRDLEFVEAARRYVSLHFRFERALAPMLAWLQLLDLLEPSATNLIGEAKGPDAQLYAGVLRSTLDAARRQALSQIKALVQVLDGVAQRELGLDAEAVLAIPMPGCSWMLKLHHAAIEQAEVAPGGLVSLRAELEGTVPTREPVDAVS